MKVATRSLVLLAIIAAGAVAADNAGAAGSTLRNLLRNAEEDDGRELESTPCSRMCATGYCCSQWGFCGGAAKTNDAWCGTGCQPAYTRNNGCYSSGAAAPSPTPKPSSTPTATPKPSTSTTTGTVVLSGTAALTYYNSYPSCCPGVPNYDGNAADTTECTEYSGCDYQGQFAYYQNLTFEQVKQTRIVSFFNTNGSNYGGKRIQLTKGGKTVDAVIADTCGDADCDGCCTQNAGSYGYLADVEYFTVMAWLGSTDAADGSVSFKIFK